MGIDLHHMGSRFGLRSFFWWLKDCTYVFCKGIFDGIDVRQLYFFMRRSDVIRSKFLKSLFSYIFFAFTVMFFDEYVLKWIESWNSSWSSTLWWMMFLSQRIIFCFIYVIVLVVSALWGDDMCKHAFYLSKSFTARPSTFEIIEQPALDALSGELLWTVATRIWALPQFLQFFIPTSLILPAQVLHMSWVIALYSFEVRWILLKWPCELRFVFFEERALYLMGFGLPLSSAITLSGYASSMLSNAVFGAGLTFTLVFAFCANPIPVTSRPNVIGGRSSGISRTPLFSALLWQSRSVLQLVTENIFHSGEGGKHRERSEEVRIGFETSMSEWRSRGHEEALLSGPSVS
eukprot:GDKJ01032345.1.p1 GENE.GDKJ01032345.1~~GDKJ01032345.1.p1  ORF type:complete len:347 (-),score=17.42 GDKJ01032345.1:63-1103(-)